MGERLHPHISGLVVRQKRNGRAVYDEAAKRALVEAALQPDVSLARLALDHAVNANLLRKWVRQHQAESAVAPGMLPVVSVPEFLPSSRPSSESLIEIVVGTATVRLLGGVDADQLRMAMACLAPRG